MDIHHLPLRPIVLIADSGGAGSWPLAGRPPCKPPEHPVLDDEKRERADEDHRKERDYMRENQPVFLVMRALFKKPDGDPQCQQRGDHLDQF